MLDEKLMNREVNVNCFIDPDSSELNGISYLDRRTNYSQKGTYIIYFFTWLLQEDS